MVSRLFAGARALALSAIAHFPALDAYVRLAWRRKMATREGYPDWAGVIGEDAQSWTAARAASETGQKVLVATSIGAHLGAMQLETMLAAAMIMRGAKVDALLCDQVLPGCQMCEPRLFPDGEAFARTGPQAALCGFCFDDGRRNYEELGVPVHRYSETLTAEDAVFAQTVSTTLPVAEIEHYVLDGLNIGEHAKAGALRFFARATLDDEPAGEKVLRRYLKAAILTARAVDRLMEQEGYTVALAHHGIYVPQGVIGEVARKRGVRVVNWNPAYRKNCFLFSHHDTYHHTLMDEPTSVWENLPWPPERRQRISDYLRSRWQGDNDWIKFHENPVFGKERIIEEIGCDPDRPIIGCLTNVMWDAQLHYPRNAFPDMLAWLAHTVRYFETRPDIQLVIRVHPAEIRGSVPTRQPVVAELARLFPKLPDNVFVVGPESNISTYVLSSLCDSVIIYGTKTGVELTSVGIPVIVAGEAWIRNKGVTTDVDSQDNYDQILSSLPVGRRLPEEAIERALRYADHFFFRRMIPVSCYEPGPGWPPYRFSGRSMAALAPGADVGLDCICDGILRAQPFIYG